MAFFDQFKEKVSDLAQAGVAKSKQMAEIAKLKAANMSEQETMRKAYQEIGRRYYAEKGANPDADYAAACAKIAEAKANIAANNDKIEALKDGNEDMDEEILVVEESFVQPTAEDVTVDDLADEEDKAE